MTEGEQIHELRTDIGKLWGAFREFVSWTKSILVGPEGNNGINGNVKEIKKDLDSLSERLTRDEEKFTRIWEVERELHCLGIKALDAHKEDLKKEEVQDEEAEVPVKVAEINMKTLIITQVGVALIAAVPTILTLLLSRPNP